MLNYKSLEVNVVISRKKKNLSDFFFIFYYEKRITVFYGARVRASVFRIKFRCLVREFESVETSPGFASLLGENWF